MTKTEQVVFFERFVAKQKEILLSKGDDYAGDDRLSSFKRAGAICGLTAEQSCLSLIATKVARLGELLQGKVPKNEGVDDSILDLVIYGALLAMIRSERGKDITINLEVLREHSQNRDAGFTLSSLM